MSDNPIRDAYFAGIADGEGCFGLYNHHKKMLTPQFSVGLSIKGEKIVSAIKDSYGGYIVHYEGDDVHSPVVKINLRGHRILSFLKDIRPYLILKDRQCDILIEFIERSTDIGNYAGKWSGEFKDVADRMKEELTELNRRGA